MNTLFKGFTKILKDNDKHYLLILEKSIDEIDAYAGMEVINTQDSLKFRICLSDSSKFLQLIEQLNSMHNLMGIHTDFSKSMQRTATIQFTLPTIL